MRLEKLRAIGLMSGTSLDGVDAAWIETDGEHVFSTGPALTLAYDATLRSDLRRLLDRAPTLSGPDAFTKDVTRRLTERHAEAVAALGRNADIIGFHGQTILHQPLARRTWQIGDAAGLARSCGVPVAWDFRSTDVAAGGEGAPLAPIYHAVRAASMGGDIAVLNLGGVGNVTAIAADGSLLAFDTGPGNGPLDDWAARHTNDSIDRDGALSAAGRVNDGVLARLMADPYFTRPAPKSLDRLDFARSLAASGVEALSPADGAATLVAFTAASVAAATIGAPPRRWLITGGGRHNATIMAALRSRLAAPVDPVEAVGWDGDALEAECFALLAVRVRYGLPLSFPGTTAAPCPMPGGRIALP
jgi:anhydro-N-acetylmuramic acid kinase